MSVPPSGEHRSQDPHDRQRFHRDAAWSYLYQGGRIAATTAITFVLAKVLGPGAFGIVALGTVYVTFSQMVLQDPALIAVIQRRDLSREHQDAAFWGTMLLSIFAVAATVILAGALASFYRQPVLAPILTVLALCIPIRGLAVVHDALLQRQLRFKALTLRTQTSIFVGGAFGIAAAFAGAGVWALVVQNLVTEVVGSTTLWLVEPFRPRFRWSKSATGDLIGFAGPSATSSIGVFLTTRADVFIMAFFFSPFAVGIYRLAFRLVDTILTATARSIQMVSLPHLARLQCDLEAFRTRLLSAQRLVALTTLPPLGVLAATADPVVRLLGGAWIDAVPVLRVLCLAVAFSTLSQLLGPTLQALGRPALLATIYWSRGLVGVVAFTLVSIAWRSAPVAAQLVAYGFAFTALQAYMVVVALRVGARLTDLRARRQVRTALPAACAALLAAAVSLVREPLRLGTLPTLADLTLTGIIALVVAGIAVLSFDPEVRTRARHLLRDQWRARTLDTTRKSPDATGPGPTSRSPNAPLRADDGINERRDSSSPG